MSTQRHIYKPAATTDDDQTHRDDNDGEESSSFCDRMNNPIVFSIFSLLATSVGVAGIVYQSACVTTIEKRFQLKSQQTAFLPIVTDGVGVLTLLFLVHYASSRHRPRYMSFALMMTGLGFALYSVPHFLYSMPPLLQSYQVGDTNGTTLNYHTAGTDDVCSDGSTVETCTVDQVKESGTLFNQAFWLFLGAGIAGLSTSFYPLYIVHIDDGVEKKKLPIYLGMLFAVFGSGGLIGYGLAIVFLQIPAYITDPEFMKLTPYDPRFIGAWWLGFLILGILQVTLALPIFFFPRFLPKPKSEENESVDDKDMTALMIQSAKFEVAREEGESYISGLVKSIWRVLSRPTLVFCFLCYIALSVYFAGFSIFGPKYMQIQFSINPHQTAMLFAILMLPPGIFGNLVGGIVVRIFGETRTKIALIVLILGGIVMLLEVFFLWFGCQNGNIAGLTVPYDFNREAMMDMELPNLEVGCLQGCGCKDQYNPVCGSDGLTYATACFAGCRSQGKAEIGGVNSTVYLDCACIPSPSNVTFYADGGDVSDEVSMDTSYAVPGACPSDTPCPFLVPYLVLNLLVWTGGTMMANPIVILQIRSVDLADRPMCIAVGNILGKLFGVLPAPAIYGAIIDSVCLMFQSSCGQSGSCVVYDIEKYRYTFNGLNLLMRIFGTVFLFLAYLSVKFGWDAKKKNKEDQNHEEKKPMKMESTV